MESFLMHFIDLIGIVTLEDTQFVVCGLINLCWPKITICLVGYHEVLVEIKGRENPRN